jgi:release factor glutamine methyltransferase
MNIGEVYREGKRLLVQAGCDSPDFDAGCLFEKVFGFDRQQRILQSYAEADAEKAERYLALARERAGGRPLQYILGEWQFLGMMLEVGEGVLVPREETELLVRTAAEMLKERENPQIADLCAGTGAVALGLASLLPDARVKAVEKFPAAMRFLRRNIKKTGLSRVEAVLLDVLDAASTEGFPALDAVVSNPPYVRREEIPTLQREVQREPHEALDGGEDGLVFYRAIAEIWLPKLKPGGVAAVEIGEGQAEDVAKLFAGTLEKIHVFRDLNGIERVVSGMRRA